MVNSVFAFLGNIGKLMTLSYFNFPNLIITINAINKNVESLTTFTAFTAKYHYNFSTEFFRTVLYAELDDNWVDGGSINSKILDERFVGMRQHLCVIIYYIQSN